MNHTYLHRNMMNHTSKDVKDVKFYERGGQVRDKKRFEENQVRSLPIPKVPSPPPLLQYTHGMPDETLPIPGPQLSDVI